MTTLIIWQYVSSRVDNFTNITLIHWAASNKEDQFNIIKYARKDHFTNLTYAKNNEDDSNILQYFHNIKNDFKNLLPIGSKESNLNISQ